MAAALIFVLGLAIGSFLNVCIYRMPREGLSINLPRRSFCPEMPDPDSSIRQCPSGEFSCLAGTLPGIAIQKFQSPIPIVELVTGGFFVLMFYRFGISLELLHGCLLVILLVPVAWIDARWYIIPSRNYRFPV